MARVLPTTGTPMARVPLGSAACGAGSPMASRAAGLGPVGPVELSGQESCRASSHSAGGVSHVLVPGQEQGHQTGFPQQPHCQGPCGCRGSRDASWGPGVSGSHPNGSPAHAAPHPVLFHHYQGVTSPSPTTHGALRPLPPWAHVPPYLDGCGQQQSSGPARRGGGGQAPGRRWAPPWRGEPWGACEQLLCTAHRAGLPASAPTPLPAPRHRLPPRGPPPVAPHE